MWRTSRRKVESDEDEEGARTPTGPGGSLNFTPAPTAGPNRRRTTFRLSDGAGAFARPSTSTSVREAEARGTVEKAKKSFTTTFLGDEKTDVMALVEWLIEAEAVTRRQWAAGRPTSRAGRGKSARVMRRRM